jgi:hypothetical protein
MKIKRKRLKEILTSVLHEAAKEGYIQKVYRSSFDRMIKLASTGGNKNTPPFSNKPASTKKSGPPGTE